jgi:serine/threonine protein kinase/Tol biopolymer transport system component
MGNVTASNLLDDAVEQLEKAWRATPDPGFANLVPLASDPRRERVLLELIKVDQEYSWRSGGHRTLETYLEQWPELDGHHDTVVELLNAECLTRATFAKVPDPEELQSRFPPEVSARIDLSAIQAEAKRELGVGLAAATDTSASALDHTPARGQAAPQFQPGQRFGRYEIGGLLGRGGMGAVYRAYDTRLKREVALKIPRLDPAIEPEILRRFLREAPAAAAVRHPNICPVYDAGEIDGIFYITMARIEGQSLTEWMADRPVAPREAAKLVEKLARALAAVHAARMVHRDIKPSNVMIDRAGEPFLMDFGLARLDNPDPGGGDEPNSPASVLNGEADGALHPAEHSCLTAAGDLLGTLPYMSPEQTHGKAVGAASDIYSLGALFYQLLTGRRPFQGSPREILEAIRNSEPPRPGSLRPGLDPTLEAICLRAMSKDPNDRYQSAEDMADAIHTRLETATRKTRPPRRHRWMIWLGAAAALASLVVIIEIKTDRGTTPPIRQWIETPANAAGARLSSDGKTLYMAFSEYPSPSRIRTFDVATGKLLQTIVSPSPEYHHNGIALSGDDRYVYVTNYFRRDISRFDLRNANQRTNLPIGNMRGAAWATYIGMTPDRRKLAVTVGNDGRSEDLDNDQISIVDVADGRFALLAEIRLADEPQSQVVFDADSRFGYVVTRQRKSPGPTLYEICMTPPFGVTRRLAFPKSNLTSVAVSKRCQRIFVSDPGQRKIHVVDLRTFKARSDLKLGEFGPGPLAMNGRDDVLCVVSPESRKLFLLNPDDGAVLARVDGLREGAAGAEFSPDQRRLFVWHRGSNGGVAVIDVSGVPGGLAFASNRAGGGLVFASNRAGEDFQIYRMPPGEKEAVRLTSNHAADRCPRWSPDGCKIAYLSTERGLPKICVTDCRGAERSVLEETDPMMPDLGATFDWSPDATEIAFIGGEGRAIRIVNLGDGKVRSLVKGELGDGCAHHLSLCWRKNNGLILVSSQSPASSHQQGTFLIDSTTRKITRVMGRKGKSDFLRAPVSSPDGRRIAALLAHPDDLPPKKICLADLDGAELSCLVDADDNTQPQLALRWFPDGKSLCYSALRDKRYHVFVVDIASKKSMQATDGDCDDIEPDACGGAYPR